MISDLACAMLSALETESCTAWAIDPDVGGDVFPAV
jgi:hypothetical protein